MTTLSRADQVGEGPFDSIKWAFETHVKVLPDTGEYNCGILHGNEDAPLRIQFWRNPEPAWNEPADFEWTPPASEEVALYGRTEHGHDRLTTEPGL